MTMPREDRRGLGARRWRSALPAAATMLALTAAQPAAAAPAAQAAPLGPETIAAREYVFGAENVAADGLLPENRVIFSWLGVATFAASLEGEVVLLDTFINGLPPATCSPAGSPPSNPAQPGLAPVSYEQLIALRPEAIFIGHGHYDHECYTGPIAALTGARVVGLPQHCEQARMEAAAAGLDEAAVRCLEVLAADSEFGAMRIVRPLSPRLYVRAFRNVHSGAGSAPAMNSAGAESVAYRFRQGQFSFFWNDSAGPLREHAPGLLEKLRAVPTDIQLGAILGFGFPEQGLRDPADYAEALEVRRLYSTHHDLFQMPTLSALQNQLMAAELEERGLGSIYRPLSDPADYLRPIVIRPRAPRWAER